MDRSILTLIGFVVVILFIILSVYTSIGNLRIDTIVNALFGAAFLTALYFNPTSAIFVLFAAILFLTFSYRRWQNHEGFYNQDTGRKMLKMNT